ncbi:MAG TPA: CDP-alcohol phosphatidyltransferase family protein [Victivallales bacterium]|nr:CDP-alcohol phosphatidyltransferase family protein [Victivallales bacterium]HPO90986.1 CDP-alcohol phosphatidyltransferase family protein [Victivallales bacterium]HRR06418.1 CDP-alcohol phosphatidyltransferase family protein [Victivallales bacterium]HRR28242.1 CDP-alcohol phosphatidyltransferase family protein [Victivallales bacterium]HRU01701.1 CDP-alcohol phosphatidyltransferase family protein [Victivallales bacterium]
MIKNNKWIKWIPNFLTVCNSLCGFAAILYTLNVYENPKEPAPVFAISCWIILFAMIFDALDGFTARILNAASLQGLQMDSLSDMVTFGVAPAVVVAIMAHCLRDLNKVGYYFVWTMCAVFIGCAAYRLAKYNIHAILEKKKSSLFSGLPTPGAAAGICSLVIYYSLENIKFQGVIEIIPAYTGLLGLLMVSNIRYIHAGKWLQSAKRNPIKIFFILSIAISIFIRPAPIIIFLINFYILSGPIGEVLDRFFHIKLLTPDFDITPIINNEVKK